MIPIRIASYSSPESPFRIPRTAEISAATIRMMTRTSRNWERKIVSRLACASCWSSFGPWREKRQQAQSRQRGPSPPEVREMAETTALMFEVGIIMLVAFMGAAIASRFRLSVIIGYIVAGILIGPHVWIAVGGLSYQGVITDNAFIQDLSRVGLEIGRAAGRGRREGRGV